MSLRGTCRDQHLVTRATTPPPGWQQLFGPPQDVRDWRAQLDDLRGRPIAPFGVPPGQANLGSGGPRTQYTAQEPSVLNTFRLQQPIMPPFAANDNRSPGPPPGMTLNSSNNVTPLFGSMPMTAPPMLGHPTNLRQREKDILSRFETQ